MLKLNQSEDQITLCITDDGQGFEARSVDGGHLGLQIMRERADNIGADLTISSCSGQGTEIFVVWPGTGSETQA
jgi:nitrate/nitrite-specific signal transduction histidine kinase